MASNLNSKIFSCVIGVLFLQLALLSSSKGRAFSGYSEEIDSQIELQIQGIDFIEALTAVSRQSGVVIVFHGEMPTQSMDVSVSSVKLEEAIERLVRQYGIKNHSVVFQAKENAPPQVDLYTFTTENSYTVLPFKGAVSAKNNLVPLSLKEKDELFEKSEIIRANTEEDKNTLSAEQLDKLKILNSVIVEKEKKSKLSFSEEQLRLLENNNGLAESMSRDSSNFLTPGQLKELKVYQVHNTLELNAELQPLTQEQMSQLNR